MLVRRRQILRSKLLDLPGSGRSVSARDAAARRASIHRHLAVRRFDGCKPGPNAAGIDALTMIP